MQGQNKYIYIVLFFLVFSFSILLNSCGKESITVAEELSKATPLSFFAESNQINQISPTDSSTATGSSYVKIIDSEESTEKGTTDAQAEEEALIFEEGLDKRIYREGELVAFDPVGVDPDGDIITYKYSKPLDSSGKWQTVVGDAGTYLVTITASDGKTEVEKKVILLILSTNRAPTIDGVDDMIVPEGTLVVLKPRVFDYNNDEIILTYSKPFDLYGEWQTDYDDSGTYLVKISACDNQTTTEKQITIEVINTNRAPVLEEIQHISVYGGDLIAISPRATEPDNDSITFVYSAPLDKDGRWQTSEDDVGSYTATVTATDGDLSSAKLVSIIVNHKNKAPVISFDDEVRAEETDRVVLKPTIVDIEGDSFTVAYSEPFDENGVWVTDYYNAGEYRVTITATDSKDATSSFEVKVVIYDRNRPPVFKI